MKKLIVLALALMVAAPAFAESTIAKNIQTGSRNAVGGWVEVMDGIHEQAAKGKGAGEQLAGVAAGGVVGLTKAIHRTGAGAIDLLTFWIPKKQPLINPEKARLE